MRTKMPKNVRRQTMDHQLKVLFRDFDLRMDGQSLVRVGIPGFTSDRSMGRFSDAFRAAEWVRPIVCDAEFSARLTKIMG